MRLNILLRILSGPCPGCVGRLGCWALARDAGRAGQTAGVGGICGLREEEQPGMCFPPPTPADLVLVCFSGGGKCIPSGGEGATKQGTDKKKIKGFGSRAVL